MTLEELLNEYMRYPAFAMTVLSDVNQIGDFGDAPLHLASRRGVIEEMQVLLDNGADIEIRGEFQFTPLHGAVIMGKLEAVKLLLKHGANPNVVNIDKRTPLDTARTNILRDPSTDHTEILKILESHIRQ